MVGIVSTTLDQVKAFGEPGTIPQNVNYAVKADYILPPRLLSVINYGLVYYKVRLRLSSHEDGRLFLAAQGTRLRVSHL